MNKDGRDSRRLVWGFLGVVVVGLLLGTALSGSVAAHTGDDGGHHHDGWMGTHNGMDGWTTGGVGFVWMLIWTVILVSIPVVLVYLLLDRRDSASESADEDALAVLRRRYAEGELDDEEFDARRRKLRAED